MIKELYDGKEMNFLDITETYPDDYILMKITEHDNTTGKLHGIALCTGSSDDEVTMYAKTKGILYDTTIVLQGDNLDNLLVGLL